MKIQSGAWEDSGIIKGLELNSQHLHKKIGVVAHAYDPITKQVETEAPVWPAQTNPQTQALLRYSSSQSRIYDSL